MTLSSASVSSGVRGVYQVLGQMRAFVDEGKCNPTIIKAARSAVYMSPEKSAQHEITTIFELVRDGIRYVADVYGVETISQADKTLMSRQGDCDDQVILLCALLESIGYRTRFVIAGYHQPGIFEHVYCQVWDGDASQWIDCDPTEHEPLGWAPPEPLAYAVERV